MVEPFFAWIECEPGSKQEWLDWRQWCVLPTYCTFSRQRDCCVLTSMSAIMHTIMLCLAALGTFPIVGAKDCGDAQL